MAVLNHIFFCYLMALFYSAYMRKALIVQQVFWWRQMPHSGLWSPPLITLEFSLLSLLSVELSICPPCSIFNLNLFSNINKFSIFGYLCDIFFKRDVKKILGSIVSFFKKCTSNNRCLVGKKFKLCC